MNNEEKKINTTESKPKVKFNTKKLKYGSIATAMTIVVIAVIVLVNVIVGIIGERTNLSFDLTSQGNFEISQESIDYLTELNQDVEIVTMISENILKSSTDQYYKQAYEVLKKYELYSDKVNVKFVDMTADPTYANKFSEIYKGTISSGSIVVNSGNRIKVISIYELYNTEINYQTYSTEIVSSKAEQVLTSAIMYVTDLAPKSAVLLSSESAGTSAQNVQLLLENDGFDVSSVDPLTNEIPMDADLIVINAPVNDYSEEIINQLYNFLENDGNYDKNLIYIANYAQNDTTNIDAFLADWGIQVGDGVIGETNTANLATSSTYFAIQNYIVDNNYSTNVSQPSLPVISYNSRPVNILFETSGNVSVTSLLRTDDTTFLATSETTEVPDDTASYNTIVLANKYAFDSDNNQHYSNVLVFGSSDMLESGLTGTTYYNNGDYFVSIVNTMVGKEAGITIVAKDLTAASFASDATKFYTSFWFFIVIIPAAVLITGIAVWLRRRHK